MDFDEWFTQRREHTTFFKAGVCWPIAKDAWDAALTAANERIRELTDAFEDAENRIVELREVSDKLAQQLLAATIYLEAIGGDGESYRAALSEVAAIRTKGE